MQEMVPEASRVRFSDVKGCQESVAEVLALLAAESGTPASGCKCLCMHRQASGLQWKDGKCMLPSAAVTAAACNIDSILSAASAADMVQRPMCCRSRSL